MRLPLGISVVAALLAGIVWVASQRPEIRALFESAPRPENPLDFLEDLPEVRGRDPQERSPEGRTTGPASAAAGTGAEGPTESFPEAVNQVPNEELSRVLMQILAARRLAEGISIAVTDREVAIYGEAASPEQRRQVLEIVEQGREARRINAENFGVRAN